jgi:phosphoserine phosphatase
VIIHFIRHGETSYNRQGLALGTANVPLTALGEEQAAAVAHELRDVPLDRIYTSPLARAAMTAQAIAAHRDVPIEARHELTEMDVGTTEGMPFPALRETHAEFLLEWTGPNGHHAIMPGGESIVDVALRVEPFAEELIRQEYGAVAVVSHNFVQRVLFCRLIGLPVAAFRSVVFDVASVSTLSLQDNRISVLRLNDNCHLKSLNLDPAGRSL